MIDSNRTGVITRPCWFSPFFHPKELLYKDSSIFSNQRKSYGRKRFLYGLKCFKQDEYMKENDSDGNDFQSPVYSCKFGASKDTNSLLGLAYEDGRIVLQQTTGPNEGNFLIDKEAHKNAIFEICWVPEKNEIISAVADFSLRLWSLKDDLVPVQDFFGHEMSVKCADVNHWDPNVFASGGRDCNVIVWDTRCQPNHKADMISGAHITHRTIGSSSNSRSFPGQVQNSIMNVAFSQQYSLISSGASDGILKIWDLRKTYCRSKREPQSLHVLEYPGVSSCKGYTSLCMSPNKDRVYVSCLDGKIYGYHLANPSPKPIEEYFGHRVNTYYTKICLSPCGSFLVSGSSDRKAYVWLTDSPGQPIVGLCGHDDEVTSVAWSSNNMGMLVTCSDDMKHRIFKYIPVKSLDLEKKNFLRSFAMPYAAATLLPFPRRFFNSPPVIRIPSQPDVRESANVSGGSPVSNFGPSRVSHPPTSPDQQTPSQMQITPSRPKTKKHVTPKTGERSTLLSWLSSSKTPNGPSSSSLSRTPTSQPSSSSKNVSKRKLSELMNVDQENRSDEERKPVVSPSKSVLLEDNKQVPSTSSCVAKMLKYEDDKAASFAPSEEEDADSFKFIDKREEGFPEECLTPKHHQAKITDKTPVKCSPLSRPHLSPLPTSLITSPTANLPNYVLDGRSPHNRREPRVTRQRQADWLTSLGQKNKFAQSMKRIDEEEAAEAARPLAKRRTPSSKRTSRLSRTPTSKRTPHTSRTPESKSKRK